MSKGKIIDKKSERSIRYEKELLSKINHPFIVNMNYAFQDAENLYLVMDLLNGGDLRYHISKHKKFSEEQTSIKLNNCRILCCLYIAFF
jgi:serine/threonine protein kinase